MELSAERWLARPGIRRLLIALDAEAGRARFVGGAVRDALLDLRCEDLDLATTFTPAEVIERLEAAGIKAVPTGIAHGTVTAVSSGTVVEVTTLRTDVTTDGRRATVAFTGDWKDDASRRDFTINALYADPLTGELFDYFGGLDDLRERRVRFIGEPLVRIAEDHLRILRFFRFHARFGIPGSAPDAASLAACAARANDLMALSRERIAGELMKLLALPDPSPTLALMEANGIFEAVLPEFLDHGAELIAALAAEERKAGLPPEPVRRLVALLPRDPTIVDKVTARLKLSNKARARARSGAATDLDGTPRALAFSIGISEAQDRLLLAHRAEDAASLTSWTVPRLPINGGELIVRGMEQGPVVAKTLKAIEKNWVAAGFPTGDAFRKIVDDQLG